jgi:hypothetical protein
MSNAPQIDSGLIRRLPPTFGPALRDQLSQWSFLFPAEQRRLRGQLDWLARLPREQFDRLFSSLIEIETRMDLPPWKAGVGLSVRDAGILARSPEYPAWRSEVEKVFTRIESEVSRPGRLDRLPRLLVCSLPSGIPLDNQPPWPDLGKEGWWVSLDRPFGETMLAFAASIAKRASQPALEAVERTWVFACDQKFSGLTSATVLSWGGLEPLRHEFLRRLNTVARDLGAVDATNDNLRRTDISRLVAPELSTNQHVREFVRSLFLSGNGSLVFCNSFVQWGASEALRRVEPQALIASFGMRQKLKPFSSAVLFEDQRRSNPVPDADDPAGSLVDAVMLSKYTYLAAQRVSCYPDRTVTILTASDSNRIKVLAPVEPAFPRSPLMPEDLTAFALRWLAADA